jgi:hypothetical protein
MLPFFPAGFGFFRGVINHFAQSFHLSLLSLFFRRRFVLGLAYQRRLLGWWLLPPPACSGLLRSLPIPFRSTGFLIVGFYAQTREISH